MPIPESAAASRRLCQQRESPFRRRRLVRPEWDSSTSGHNTGWTSGGWGPYDAYATINGAYWQKAAFADTGAGSGVAVTLTGNPTITSRYFSLWLDMPAPNSARSGYELRFTETGTSVYEVALSKWQAGTKTHVGHQNGLLVPDREQVRAGGEGWDCVGVDQHRFGIHPAPLGRRQHLREWLYGHRGRRQHHSPDQLQRRSAAAVLGLR